MKYLLLFLLLALAGCGDAALTEAREDATRWKWIAILGIGGAVLVGIGMGSSSKEKM